MIDDSDCLTKDPSPSSKNRKSRKRSRPNLSCETSGSFERTMIASAHENFSTSTPDYVFLSISLHSY